MATMRTVLATHAIVVGCLALDGVAGLPSAVADPSAVTCHEQHSGGVDEDVCVGNPEVAAGVDSPDFLVRVDPRWQFGVGAVF